MILFLFWFAKFDVLDSVVDSCLGGGKGRRREKGEGIRSTNSNYKIDGGRLRIV